jgi:hypothetical protein
MTEFVDSDDSQIGYEVTGLTAAAEEIIAARPEQLDHPGPPRRGARFTGHNRLPNGFEYEVTCVVTKADRPRAFAGWSWMTAVTLSARPRGGGTRSTRSPEAAAGSSTASPTARAPATCGQPQRRRRIRPPRSSSPGGTGCDPT